MAAGRAPPIVNRSTTMEEVCSLKTSPPKVLLRQHQPLLVQYIDLDSLIPYLNQQLLLTDDENEILLNLYLSNRKRVLKLLQFVESKGEEGFLRFLRAIESEQEHMGHVELTKLFRTYRKRYTLAICIKGGERGRRERGSHGGALVKSFTLTGCATPE